MTVFVDLDGVLCNFRGGATDYIVSRGLAAEDLQKEFDKPNWGILSEYKSIYLDLEPLPDAKCFWDFMSCKYPDVRILTSLPTRAKILSAEEDKRRWVARHINRRARVEVAPSPYDKQFYCKNPTDILIDDSELNCAQWLGIAVLHTSVKIP